MRVCVCVCVCVCARARMRACVRACVRACMPARMHVCVCVRACVHACVYVCARASMSDLYYLGIPTPMRKTISTITAVLQDPARKRTNAPQWQARWQELTLQSADVVVPTACSSPCRTRWARGQLQDTWTGR